MNNFLSNNKLRAFIYGMGDLGPSSIDVFLKVYLLIYFNQILGLSPSLTSLAIGLGVFWDAILDPWIGIWSDRYYKKHKSRKALIYAALVLSIAAFYFLWRIPNLNQMLTFWLLFLISSLLNSALSLYSVPYIALANDFIADNELRKPWIAWRLAFYNIGSFVGLIVAAYFLTTQAVEIVDASLAYKKATVALAVTMLFTAFFSTFYTYQSSKNTQLSYELNPDVKVSFFSIIKDKLYLKMMMSYFVVSCGIGLNSALALYYYKNYLEFSEIETQKILVGFLTIFTLSIPLWVYLTKFFSKKNLIIVGAFLMGLLTVLTFPNFKDTSFTTIFFLASGVGGVLTGVAVIIEIYLSDFLKAKEEAVKQSVSGQYLGVWKMASKLSRAVAIALAGPIIENSKDYQVLANYFGWGVGIFFILAAVIIALPIGEEV